MSSWKEFASSNYVPNEDQTIQIRNTIFEAIVTLSPKTATRADGIAESLQSIAKSLEVIAAAMTKQEEK